MSYDRFSRPTRQHRTALIASCAVSILLSVGAISVTTDEFFGGGIKLNEHFTIDGLVFLLAVWWFISFWLSARADLTIESTAKPVSDYHSQLEDFHRGFFSYAGEEYAYERPERRLSAGNAQLLFENPYPFVRDPEAGEKLAALEKGERDNLRIWLESARNVQLHLVEKLPSKELYEAKLAYSSAVRRQDVFEYYLPIALFVVTVLLWGWSVVCGDPSVA